MPSQSKRPIVYLVEDDTSVRVSVSNVLTLANYKVEAFGTARDFLNKWDQSKADCVVLDVRLPDLDGLEVLQELRAIGDLPPIIIVTGYANVQLAVEAMKLGASDLLEKPVNPDLLRLRVSELLRAKADDQKDQQYLEIRKRFDALSTREKQVMKALCQGLQNKQVAQDLGISMRTIEFHRNAIYEKMNIRNIVELTRISILAGLD
jgi:FixJ family two-component response regulator